MMERLQLKVLQQVENYVKPYQVLEGFNRRWWHDSAGRLGEDTRGGTDYIQFLADDVEVGRAEVTDWQLSDSYIGIDSEVPTKEIWFFEIRRDFRRQQYGAEFARYLIRHYAACPLIAFSHEADEFWAGIGWHYYPRKDGDTLYRKLFVSQPIGKSPAETKNEPIKRLKRGSRAFLSGVT